MKQVLQHADSKKHSDSVTARYGQKQKHFEKALTSESKNTPGESSSKSETSCTMQPSQLEKVATAEILWTLKVAQSNYSYSSCDGVPDLFKRMFPGHCVSEQFSMSRTKVSYLISDGLGPYYRREMCDSIRDTGTAYTLQYDETGNSQNRKQCDILVRYWSEEMGQVCVRFLKALFFGHAKGHVVGQAILDVVLEDGFQLPLAQLISLGSDGPNVNKTIWTFINEHMKKGGLPGMLAFIPCNLHVVHNAFRSGLNVFGEDAEQLVLDLFLYLKASACRKEDFLESQLDLGLDDDMLIKHVQSRWLTLIPAVKRVKEKLEAVNKYIFKDLPKAAKETKTERALEGNERYKRICRKLKDPAVTAQLHFLESLEPVFHPFLTLFQKEEPLVHILHDELSNLVRTIMLRFLKPEVVGDKRDKELLSIDVSKSDNQLSDQMLVIGESTRAKVKPDQLKVPIKDMRKFYQVATKYLVSRLPLGREILRDLSTLHPLLQKSDRGVRAIERTARKIPQIVPKEEINILTDEWKMYQAQEIPEGWYKESVVDGKSGETEKYVRIDHYWKKVLEQKNSMGTARFKVLPKLIKAVLCLAHGNAEVERSLSENKRVLTPERSQLTDESINALRLTKDAVRVTGSGQAHQMPITPSLIQARRSAYGVYSKRLAEEREKKAKTQRMKDQREKDAQAKKEQLESLDRKKRTLADRDKEVAKEQDRCREELKAAEGLYGEVTKRLQKAITDKNMQEITVVQGLMEVATQKMEGARRKLDKCQEEKKEIDEKRRKVMDKYSSTLANLSKAK